MVAAAVCPHPPLLIPEVASGAAPELDDVRTACERAVAHLVAARPDLMVIVGSGPEPSGVEVGRPDAPLSLALGSWLLDRSGMDTGRRVCEVVSRGATPDACAALGGELVRTPQRVALLVMGDGSARRHEKGPGYYDPRAESFDLSVAKALTGVDTRALLGLPPALAEELLCAGRAPWQALAGAVAADGREWTGELHYDAAPYGVAYFVATLTAAPVDHPHRLIMNYGSC